MKAEEMLDLQKKILLLCHGAGKFGLPEDRIFRMVRGAGGFDRLTEDELERQLRYLKSKSWIAEVPGQLRPDLRRWESTAAGDEYLMTQGEI
jgi:hypothetical protein